MQQMAKMGDPTDKIDFLLRKSSELLADMRRMERENQKNKKRGDTLQKEKDTNRTELTKTVTLKEKLEKLAKEDEGFNVYYVLNNPPEGWTGGVGFVTPDMIKVCNRSAAINFRPDG